jgi:hypothetical protein
VARNTDHWTTEEVNFNNINADLQLSIHIHGIRRIQAFISFKASVLVSSGNTADIKFTSPSLRFSEFKSVNYGRILKIPTT